MTFALPIHPRLEAAEAKPIPGAATGSVAVLLRAEAAIELTLAVWAYRHLGGSWTLFAALFLVPDLSMLGYLVDRRVGAWLYNFGHSYISPAVLAVAGFATAAPLLHALALIWAAHIGFDRLAGFGLKYKTAFGATHLGWKTMRRFDRPE